jgi:Uma2 family endonuclease
MQLKWQSYTRGISQIWLQVSQESRKFQVFQNKNQPPQTQMQSKQEQAKLHQSLHKKMNTR